MQTKTSTTKSGCKRTSARPKNGPNPRSRSGCATCKAKHTKCDETRPECLRCIRKGVKCGGYWKEFKWSFKHQPGEMDINIQTGPSPTPSRRGSSVRTDKTPTTALPMTILDPAPGPSKQDDLATEDASSILGDASWTSSSCTDSETDLFAQTNPIVDTSDMTAMAPNVEMTSQALVPPAGQYLESTPLTVSLIADTSSLLISNWFEQVCTAWSGFDSETNLNRKLALELCTTSHSVFSSLQSMSAGFLSTRLPNMRQSAMYFLQAATGSVLSEAKEVSCRTVLDTIPSGLLFSLFCLGTTVCWVDARQLGLPFFREAKMILKRLNRRLSTYSEKDLELLSFFNRSFAYCEMLLAAVEDETNAVVESDNTIIGPRTDPNMQLAERYIDNSPHPWTGISPLAAQLFAQSIRLCRSFRRHLKLPKETERDFQRALEEIQEAQRLEERLLGLEFSAAVSVTETGDYRTPALHLSQIAEAYQLAALLQLYQTFPDLVALRLPLDSAHANSRHIPWEEWIIPLSLRLVNVLEQIPPNSGTRVIQPLLYITASTGLRYDTMTLLEVPGFSFETAASPVTGFQPGPFGALPGDPMEALGTSPASAPPGNLISRMSLDISNARHFITGRLNMLENTLPPKPVVMARELIKAIWDAYDNEAPGSATVHWVDVMEDKNLRSMFG
ncbi:fungal-specific transcription factor domain-containing protein [Fusarium solani]|uniref:Fungal-specific transcription factor domain-containing protein n=1 Tax=Fusarium solani TaxID=169388 RepID=A0A9P9HIZ1_FUSSL|nr:fungal-specific transcription factor domain-containing protein [Fusarium solani]KAH7258440.1 fungal-specific transcription factor domain-containing protein [Fusarium solani]